MKCFTHSENEAVGSCKFCFRGVCTQCARDSGVGLACSETCEAQVKSVQALVDRNKKLVAFAPKTHSRNALMLTLMAAAFIAFGLFSEIRFMSAFFIVFGGLMLCGAALSFLNSRKITKTASPDNN